MVMGDGDGDGGWRWGCVYLSSELTHAGGANAYALTLGNPFIFKAMASNAAIPAPGIGHGG